MLTGTTNACITGGTQKINLLDKAGGRVVYLGKKHQRKIKKRASKWFNVVSKCDDFWDFSKTKNMSYNNPCQKRPSE
jgi:hypothetical protein